jgi:hypothetical protein
MTRLEKTTFGLKYEEVMRNCSCRILLGVKESEVGRSCRMYAREVKCFQNSISGSLRGRDHFLDLGVNGRMCGAHQSCENCDGLSGSVRTERFTVWSTVSLSTVTARSEIRYVFGVHTDFNPPSPKQVLTRTLSHYTACVLVSRFEPDA